MKYPRILDLYFAFKAISQIQTLFFDFGKLSYHEPKHLAKAVFDCFVYTHCFLREKGNQQLCPVEMNISERCSPDDSDSLTQSVISVQDEDEEESGKMSEQTIFALVEKHHTHSVSMFAAISMGSVE